MRGEILKLLFHGSQLSVKLLLSLLLPLGLLFSPLFGLLVVLTTFADRSHVIDAIDAGAVGYLLKDSGPDQLEAGIRAAARGESPLDPKVAGALLAARQDRR